MRYLTVAADYTQSCLRDDFEGPIQPESLGLPADLCSALRSWNEAYRRVIPMDEEERSDAEIAALICQLDEQGRDMASRVQQVAGEAKVRYFSEGELRYLC